MKKIVLLILFIVSVYMCQAWNAQGHMMIASIAYKQLSSKEKATLTNMLKAHPEYKRKWKNEYDEVKNEMELGMYLLIRASIWPDDIRSREHPGNSYHRGPWHYINYEIRFNGADKTTVPQEENIVWAINNSMSTIQNKNSNPLDKSVHISWLSHLVGDMHQPLHAGSLYNDVYPKGDRGGNDFFIKPNNKGLNLHYFWDAIMGASLNPRIAKNEATKLMANQGRKKFRNELKKLKAVNWSCESFDLAKNIAYRSGKLKGSNSKQNAPKVDKDYPKQARAVADVQVALAGYRLAEMLKKVI